jgi:hypothetical protein
MESQIVGAYNLVLDAQELVQTIESFSTDYYVDLEPHQSQAFLRAKLKARDVFQELSKLLPADARPSLSATTPASRVGHASEKGQGSE